MFEGHLLTPLIAKKRVVSAIKRVTTDGDFRRVLIDRGRRQAERYTWHRTADRVRNVYEEVASAGEVRHTQQPQLAASY